MFYQSVKSAYIAGRVQIGLPPVGQGDHVTIEATGVTRILVAFLTDAERQMLGDLASDELHAALNGSVQKCPECEGMGTIRFVGQETNTSDLQCPWCNSDGKIFVEDEKSSETAEAAKLPVFGVTYVPGSPTLEDCVGWACDEHEALQLVQELPETAMTASVMSRQFGGEYALGGVIRDRKIIQDPEGPYYSADLGTHRYQEIFRAYLECKTD